MKIFISGATGYIGSEVVRALREGQAEILGLTRSAEKAAALKRVGVRPVEGTLLKPEAFKKELDACDVLIHAAFDYGPQALEADKTMLEAMIASARSAKARRLIVYTSGVWVLGRQTGKPADEATPPSPLPLVAWRVAHERLALDAAGGKVSSVVVRPGCVYGGRLGLYASMFQAAVEKRAIKLAGDGANAWATVYLDDIAQLYRLVVEKAPEREIYHGTDGSHEPLKTVAASILDAAGGGKVEPLAPEEARKVWGPMTEAFMLDQRISSDKARRTLGWKPSLTSTAKNAMLLLEQWSAKAGRTTPA